MLADRRISRPFVLSTTVLLALGGFGCNSIAWEHSFKSGLAKAAEQQRPALVMFDALFNRDCGEMDRGVFTDPEVRAKLEGFVRIRLNYSLNRKLAGQFGVEVLPTFYVLRCDGSLAGSHAGKMDVVKFDFFLIKYRYY